MNIDYLREFSYLAETLSFSITANTFFISHSVLSKHIAALEKELGARLFNRTKKHTTLTEAGRIFYADVQTVLNGYDKALQDVRAAVEKSKHILRVGYLRHAAEPFLDAFVRYVEDTHPDIAVQVTCMEYGPLIKAHRSHEVDVILSMDFDPEAKPVCEFAPIYHDDLKLVVPEGHPLYGKQGGVTKQDLQGMKFVLPRKSAYPGFGSFVASLLDGIRDGGIEGYNDVHTMFALIKRLGYLGFCSCNISSYQEGVRYLPLLYADTTYDVSAMWLQSMSADLADVAREASEFCRGYLARQER